MCGPRSTTIILRDRRQAGRLFLNGDSSFLRNKASCHLREIVLTGVFLLLAAGCAPAMPVPGGATAEVVTVLQPSAPVPGGADLPATAQPRQDLETETAVPPLPTRAPALTPTLSITPGARPAQETLADRLGQISAATPHQDYLGQPDFYSAPLDLREFHCFIGQTESEQQACLRDAGLYYYQLYQDLPYMWGGNYPYSYSVAVALKAAGDPF